MTLEAWVWPSKVSPGYSTIVAKTRAGGRFPYGLALAGGRLDAYAVIGPVGESPCKLRAPYAPLDVRGRDVRRVEASCVSREPSCRGEGGAWQAGIFGGTAPARRRPGVGRVLHRPHRQRQNFLEGKVSEKAIRDARTPVSGGSSTARCRRRAVPAALLPAPVPQAARRTMVRSVPAPLLASVFPHLPARRFTSVKAPWAAGTARAA